MSSVRSRHFNLERLQSLTDGIFAVAMTLLVLDIRIAPGFGRDTLAQGLVQLVPRLYSYVTSFFVLALFWWIYHRLISVLTHADDGFVWWNVGFLFAVTLLPFSAYLLGAFYGTLIATEMYCLNLIVLSALLIILWKHGERRELVGREVSGLQRKAITQRLVGMTVAYSCTALIGFWFPIWFWLGFGIMIPVRILLRRAVPSVDRTHW
ncbi:MAG: TMEM175 family protein [Candidatus Cybelea sp.]